ncbi:MAG: DUF3048 domain-containing protein [Halanaerobiaceae bacterium]
MKKAIIIILSILIITFIFYGCSDPDRENSVEESEVNSNKANTDTQDIDEESEIANNNMGENGERGEIYNEDADNQSKSETEELFYSPFSGEVVDELHLRKAVIAVIENSEASRPQSGLDDASIVYEVLVEGGITRFLALFWDDIPEKIGPIRSARPYQINIAEEYNALLLHAGASPEGFEMLSENTVEHLDQIYQSRYYWRSDRKAPHNLYTGQQKISSYLDKILGQEYNDRFEFKHVSLVKSNDIIVDEIRIPFWGNNTVIYKYHNDKNQYFRYYGEFETPHMLAEKEQIHSDNLIIQYVKTRQVDNVGRLSMSLTGRGAAVIFRDGIIIKGYWQKDENSITNFYNEQGKEVKLNPGQTWIVVVPDTIKIAYSSIKKDVSESETSEVDEDVIDEKIDVDSNKDDSEENNINQVDRIDQIYDNIENKVSGNDE